MKHRAPFVPLAVLLSAAVPPSCGGSDGAAPVGASGPGSGAPFTFAWPVPGRALVTETQEKEGRTVVSRYALDIARVEQGIAVSTSGFQVLSWTGLDLSRDEDRAKLGPAVAMAGAVPVLLVGDDGRAHGLLQVAEAVDRVLATLEQSGAAPEVIAKTGTMLRSDPMVASMKQQTLDGWTLWVGAWVGLALGPGESRSVELDVPLPDGTLAKAPTLLRHLGVEPGPDGSRPLVRLSADWLLEGEPARLALGRVMANVLRKAPPHQNEPFDPDDVQSFRRTTRLLVLTDPDTLQPREASMLVTTSIAIRDAGTRTQAEHYEYRFEWPSVSAPAALPEDQPGTAGQDDTEPR